MSGRIFTAPDYAALKNAFRRAVRQSGGGLRELSAMTRLSPAQLSRFGDLNSDQWAPLDVVLDMDSLAGEPVITRALGDLLGHDLVSSKAAVAHGRLVQHLAGLARESGDVLSGISDALADGELTPNELSRIENDLADLDAQVQAARATVRAKLMTLRGEA
ncbi:phage regulatory CII family protein [Ancylobacter moscoviensis]